jgi:hypothetical protein
MSLPFENCHILFNLFSLRTKQVDACWSQVAQKKQFNQLKNSLLKFYFLHFKLTYSNSLIIFSENFYHSESAERNLIF